MAKTYDQMRKEVAARRLEMFNSAEAKMKPPHIVRNNINRIPKLKIEEELDFHEVFEVGFKPGNWSTNSNRPSKIALDLDEKGWNDE